MDKISILRQIERMIQDGADIIDIGGYSSRPGATNIDADVEFERVRAGLKAVHEVSDSFPISVDTFRAEVAEKSIELGAGMVNDISGGELDDKMHRVIRDHNIPYIVMHMVGTPQNMMTHTNYEDIFMEIINYFVKKREQLTQFGIKDVIIDVGFGFSKTPVQNFDLLSHLELFQLLNSPMLIGISRKSTIYKTLGVEPSEALNGTTILNTVAILKGAAILRVHDVKEAKEIITLTGKLHN